MDNLLELRICIEATSARGPEQNLRDPELLRGVGGEAHDSVGDDARHGRPLGGGVEPPEQLPEGSQAGRGRGLAQRRYVLGDVGILRRREAVGDRLEAEGVDAVEGVAAAGVEEAAVVVVGVDEGDVEAVVVEDLGELEHGVYVALSWKWNANCMRFLSFNTHFSSFFFLERQY